MTRTNGQKSRFIRDFEFALRGKSFVPDEYAKTSQFLDAFSKAELTFNQANEISLDYAGQSVESQQHWARGFYTGLSATHYGDALGVSLDLGFGVPDVLALEASYEQRTSLSDGTIQGSASLAFDTAIGVMELSASLGDSRTIDRETFNQISNVVGNTKIVVESYRSFRDESERYQFVTDVPGVKIDTNYDFYALEDARIDALFDLAEKALETFEPHLSEQSSDGGDSSDSDSPSGHGPDA
ncbi:MAG: hypothetical protein ABJN35_00020 [Erythrobacter sp.]